MTRWQYHIVHLGALHAPQRMAAAFARLGSEGWELVTMLDKASNWIAGMESGFAVFKREVPDGQEPNGPWAQWQTAESLAIPTHTDIGGSPSNRCREGAHLKCSRPACTCSCHAFV